MRILSLLMIVLFTIAAHSQNKTLFPNQIIHKNELIHNGNNNNIKDINDVIWSNDFSVPSQWLIANQTADNQNWIITTSAPQGDVSSSLGLISSSSSSNGYALFDSDYLGVTNGTQNATISIISPINLTNYNGVELVFKQKYRRYQVDQTFIGVSTNGTNWTEIEVNSTVPDGAMVENTITVDISSLANNQSQIWIRFHYTGEWDYAWLVDDVQLTGNYYVPPQIVQVSPNNAIQTQTLTVSISGQNTHFNQGSETVWFDQASTTLYYGTGVQVSSSTSLSASFTIPYNAPTGYYNVNVQNPTDGVVSLSNGFLVNSWAPNWPVTVTSNIHTIVIPSYATITFNGSPLEPGDYVGVFYDAGGVLACGGYVQLTGNTVSVVAYQNSGSDNGFNVGEEFVWKIWKSSTNTEHSAVATYTSSGFPNSNTFVVSGLSGISTLIAVTYQTQTINLIQGWSIFSTYISPTNPSIAAVFASISNLQIVKNAAGAVYWPAYSINQIGDMVLGQGYQINMTSQAVLNITGTAAIPENTLLNLPSAWSIIGYLRQSPGAIVTMMSSIVNYITIVKDGSGSVYWPQWNVNGIGNMIPGQGYQIRMTQSTTYYYPANSVSSYKFSSDYSLTHFSSAQNTGSNMTLCIPITAWNEIPVPGDEVGVFDEIGNLVGSAVFNSENLAIAIWGNDDLTTWKDGLSEKENYFLQLFNHQTGDVNQITIQSWIEGNNEFSKDKIAVIEKLTVQFGFKLFDCFPNPAKNQVLINFSIPENAEVNISMFNLDGKKVKEVTQNFNKGINSIELNVSELSSGKYIYNITTQEFSNSKSMTIIK